MNIEKFSLCRQETEVGSPFVVSELRKEVRSPFVLKEQR